MVQSELSNAAVAGIFDTRRRDMGMIYAELAALTRMSPRSLMRYLSAEREMDIGQAMVIAEALKLDMAEVIRQLNN